MKTKVAIIGSIAAIIGTIVTIIEYRERRPSYTLTGQWNIENKIVNTTWPKYKNLQLSYKVFIRQKGLNFIGEGEKYKENDVPLASEAHTPIRIEGRIEGNKVIATCVEHGARRTSHGNFMWEIASETKLIGHFESTAANTSGPSTATKVK